MLVECPRTNGVKPSGQKAAAHTIGGGIDGDYLRNFTKAFEDSGSERVLLGYTSVATDGLPGLHVATSPNAAENRLGALNEPEQRRPKSERRLPYPVPRT